MKQQGEAAIETATLSPTKPHTDAKVRPSRYRRLCLACVGLLGVVACVTLLIQMSWDQERRLARLSLASLQHERSIHGANDPRLLYYLGLRLNQKGQFAAADPVLRRAVGIDPDTP